MSLYKSKRLEITRGGSTAAATSKIERFLIIVNGFQPLAIITKRSILDFAAALDPSLITAFNPISEEGINATQLRFK